MKIKYLLSDLDGVIRKFPAQRDKSIEEKFGEQAADLIGEVDHQYLDYVEAFFSKDSVVLLTNGTTHLSSDLEKLNIKNRFFKIFNSAEIGVCQPDKKIYEHVVKNLGCLPSEILFVGDSVSYIEAAAATGMQTYLYKSLQDFQKHLTQMVEGNWQPLTVMEVAKVFSEIKCDWRIAGGWAIDLFLGKQTRAHNDIDVLIQRNDQAALQTLLSGWDLWVSDPPGTLRPWKKGEFLGVDVQDIWCRKSSKDPWQFQVMLFDVENAEWIFKRDKSIRRSLKSVILTTEEGFKILSPEVQLLYKSKSLREKDKLDFEHTCAAMNAEQKNWLKQMLIKLYENHEWIAKL